MIRQATVKDADEIARIHVETWKAVYNGIIPDAYLQGLSHEKRAAHWCENLKKAAKGIYVAQEDDKIMGWISFGPSRDEDAYNIGEVYAIYVQPDCWGYGYGTQLMALAETKLRGMEFKTVTLWVLKYNHLARAFYTKAGYCFDGAKRQLSIGGKDLWELRYAKTG